MPTDSVLYSHFKNYDVLLLQQPNYPIHLNMLKLYMKLFTGFLFLICMMCFCDLQAQTHIPLTDFSFFQTPGPSWKLASGVQAVFSVENVLNFTPGTGIIVNRSDEKIRGKDLYSTAAFGDMDLELDYLLAFGSNSGIYLQGRYEVQLLDSWGVIRPTSADNGGIYERWNENKPDGQKGYDGHAPRQNASRGAGLWQHIKISFQAPRFNEGGVLIEHAKIIRVELNGVLIQENVELAGSTRGAMENNEVARGPLRLQGDHGSVAFKNIRITPFDHQRPVFQQLSYTVYKDKHEKEPDYKTEKAFNSGPAQNLSLNLNSLPPVFLIRYTGNLHVTAEGEYTFKIRTSGGQGTIRLAGKTVMGLEKSGQGGKIFIPAGDIPFELIYSKTSDWDSPTLGLTIAGPGIREFVMSEVSADPIDPILISASVNTILRSFSDISESALITHGVNVGSPLQVHYTYDMDQGMIVQVWHGGFLDATDMFSGRGEGLSRPLGVVLRFGKPMLTLEKLSSPDAAWMADTAGTGYRPKGYVLDNTDRPTFRYLLFNTTVSDETRVLPDGHGIHREISILQPVESLYARIAAGTHIEKIAEGLYLINDQSYYIQFDEAANLKPVLRNTNGQQELLLPVQNKIAYSILF